MSFVRIALIITFIFYIIAWVFSQDSLDWKHVTSNVEDTYAALKSQFLTEEQVKNGISSLIIEARDAEVLGRNLDAIRKLQLALHLEKQLKKPSVEAFELNYFAATFISTIDLRYGLEFYKKATDMIPHVPAIHPSSIFTMLTSRAGIHERLMQDDSALVYYRKAIQTALVDSRIAEVSSNNNLGVFYHHFARYDSAKVYFERALQMMKDHNVDHIGLYCAIKDNQAQLALLEEKYIPALNTFRFNDSTYLAKGFHNKYVINKVRLMEVMEKLNIPGIDHQISELQSFVDKFDMHMEDAAILQFYKYANDYFFETGRYSKSRSYQERYMHRSDSLSNLLADQMHYLTQSLLSLEEVRFENEMQAQALTLEKSKLQLRSAQRIILLSVFSAACIVTLLFLYFRKRRQELIARAQLVETELKNKEMESKLFEKELILKKKDLTNLVLHNTQIHDSNHKLIDRLQDITHQKDSMEKEIRSLLLELQSQNQVADRSLLLQENIESLNEEFYQKLKSQYPDLTKAEAELCGFIRINLSSKDISILKNVGTPSVKLSKNRLRKKLGITPSEDLYEFVKRI